MIIEIDITKKHILLLIGIMLITPVLAAVVSHKAEEIKAGMFGQNYSGTWSIMNGSVGINTTNPTMLLHVEGDVNVTGDLHLSNESVYIGNQTLTNNVGVLEWGGIDVGVAWPSGSHCGVNARGNDGGYVDTDVLCQGHDPGSSCPTGFARVRLAYIECSGACHYYTCVKT